MLEIEKYDRQRAQQYALTWANKRSPLFFDFEDLGGDCTNYASQCLLAGTCQMNLRPTYGWYYISASERTASWTGVEFLYNFLTTNNGAGPFARLVSAGGLEIGDIVQTADADNRYKHSLVVIGYAPGEYLVSAHSENAKNRRLSTYDYVSARYIHILGCRRELCDSCFLSLLNGTSLANT